VKAPLISEFRQMPAGSVTPTGIVANRPFWLLQYDFVLEEAAEAASADTDVAA
jgi:hypothetical protein